MSILKEKLIRGEFVISAEIGPPKGIDLKEFYESANILKGRVDAVNVTDLQSSVMKLGSLPICHFLKDMGIEPIFQITCRDRNRLALQSDLLNAAVFGIENVLVLTGDHPRLGDHPNAKPVFDLDSVQLLDVVSKLQAGLDMMGNKLLGSPKFYAGAVVNPCADPLEPELIKLEKKIAAGAQFFQTQAIYDIGKFEEFMKNISHLNIKILAGIVMLKSAGMARFMNQNVAGIHVPDELIKRMETTTDKVKTSVEISAELINKLKPMCQGIHIMPIGWEKRVPLVLDAAGFPACAPAA